MTQPTPPPGMRILSAEELKKPLPMDAIYCWFNAAWVISEYRGKVVDPESRSKLDFYATREPLPAFEPTDSEANGWRDIASAPKDGTWIQGWKTAGDQWIPKMRWNTPYRTWEHRNGGEWMHLFTDNVTHWQPLPEPPVRSAMQLNKEGGE